MSSLRAAILARDEEGYIRGCIESVLPLTADIVVIDSGSRDHTRQIAISLGARVVEREWAGFPAQRNAALALAADAQWLLFVDADERLTPWLRSEIARAIAGATDAAAGFLIPRRNVIAGHVMRGGGWWPDYQARLLRPHRCRYVETRRVHEVPDCDGQLFALGAPMVHLNFRTWPSFAARQFAYERDFCQNGVPRRRRSYLGAPAREFWHRFVLQQGYRDGAAGLAACSLVAAAKLYGVWRAKWSRE
jgi:glycosyltransferase involved in cell wall biosynthesis